MLVALQGIRAGCRALKGRVGMRSRGGFLVGALVLAVALPAPVAAAMGFSVNLSATSVQVGDTLTMTPVVTNADPGTPLRCEMWIEHYEPPENWVRMHVASNGCEPWTFVVPPGPLGSYEIVGRAYYGIWDGMPIGVVHAAQQFVELVGGGTPIPFVTNYPVQSWALEDLVSTSTPTYGEPLTIYPPATAESCSFRILGGLDVSHVHQAGGCVPWTFSIPERDTQGPGTIFSQTSDVHVMSWTGVSAYSLDEPEGAFVGIRYGEAYAVNLPDFVPGVSTSTEYTSNLPAIFGGLDRGHTGQSGDPTSFVLEPAVAGTTEGTCAYSAPPGVTPVVPGGCEDPIIVPPFLGTGTQQGGYRLELRDDEGTVLSYSDVVVGWVDDMASLQVSAPDEVDTGETTDIDASTDTGAPSEYEVVAQLEPEAAGSGLAGASMGPATVIASGTLDPDVDSSGDAVEVHHAFGAPGRYRVTATFTDVRGETTTGSTVIVVTTTDTTKPTATAPKHAFSAGSTVAGGLTPVKFTWTGSDTGTGVARYEAALSKDGGAYSLISAALGSPTVTRSLQSAHSYRLRVRAVDKAGNIGNWVFGSTFTIKAYQESSTSIIRSGTWSLAGNSSYWGGGERFATAAGASARLTFTGRSFAWIGSMGPSRGTAKVYVNGTLVKTISLYAATTTYRRVLVSLTWASSTSRTVKVVVSGTAGHPRVNVDALLTGT